MVQRPAAHRAGRGGHSRLLGETYSRGEEHRAQQQRVAVARAVAGDPLLLLADEPTGTLDSKNGQAVMELLRELHAGGATLCMVTHDLGHAKLATRSVSLFDGRVVEEEAGAAAG